MIDECVDSILLVDNSAFEPVSRKLRGFFVSRGIHEAKNVRVDLPGGNGWSRVPCVWT
jgi:hypothetical protein